MNLLRLITSSKCQNLLSKIRPTIDECFSPRILYHRTSFDHKHRKHQEKKQQQEEIDGIGWLLLIMPISTFALGTWQVKRREWKLQLLKDLHEKVSSDPISFPENPQVLDNMEYRPVRVKGEFLYDKEIRIGPKSLIIGGSAVGEKTGGLMSTTSSTGYWIVTPFKLVDRDMTILINRGWVKGRRGKIPAKELGHVPGVVELTGIVRLNETRPVFVPKNSPHAGIFVYRDINAMAELTNSSPIFLDLIARDGTPGGPIAGQTRISMRNEHMSYIITWYTLSALTAFMWYRLYILKLPLL
ncbi:surfeit locus protein 1 [Fopius arisanus]|uniref:SURF1-like protein n=1 Tax=Fopius arisanus TaxID=64838 RepID=A0A9R1U675_9HYME|nr:PREDICTED: surfeit locus protein 1 [Fopius arisanus]